MSEEGARAGDTFQRPAAPMTSFQQARCLAFSIFQQCCQSRVHLQTDLLMRAGPQAVSFLEPLSCSTRTQVEHTYLNYDRCHVFVDCPFEHQRTWRSSVV